MVEVMIQELAKSWQQRREESIVIDVSVGANVGDCPCDRKRSTQTRFGSGSSQAVVVLIGDQASQRSFGLPRLLQDPSGVRYGDVGLQLGRLGQVISIMVP